MKFLLDENFPLPLYHRLRSAGIEAEHLILSGPRGLPDSAIRQRLQREDIVFLTQDNEFEQVPKGCRATIIISRVRQSLAIGTRVDIWERALRAFLAARPTGKLFDLLESGEILPWQIRE